MDGILLGAHYDQLTYVNPYSAVASVAITISIIAVHHAIETLPIHPLGCQKMVFLDHNFHILKSSYWGGSFSIRFFYKVSHVYLLASKLVWPTKSFKKEHKISFPASLSIFAILSAISQKGGNVKSLKLPPLVIVNLPFKYPVQLSSVRRYPLIFFPEDRLT